MYKFYIIFVELVACALEDAELEKDGLGDEFVEEFPGLSTYIVPK